jgi:predicted signal transduction protein with EAL and GGDEF domain
LAATVGVGATLRRAATTIEQLIGQADAALYRAKRNGRNPRRRRRHAARFKPGRNADDKTGGAGTRRG